MNIVKALVELIRIAETTLPDDVKKILKKSYRSEKNEIAKMQLRNILENIKIAEEESIPICQDTGILTFYVSSSLGNLDKEIKEATKIATEEIPLRPNMVLFDKRKNIGNADTYIPIIRYENRTHNEITVLVKGAGSENKTKLRMLEPSAEVEEIKNIIVKDATHSYEACPPLFVGVGIGGDSSFSVELSKKALLREAGKMDRFERDVLERINKSNVGPMGLGGDTTALSVFTFKAPMHTATLPLAISINCWALRRATLIVDEGRYIC